MGFIFGHPELVELMHRAQNPFQVNSLALLAASIAIQHEGHVKKYVAQVRANRDRVYRWLESRGIPYVRSSANFILTRVGERAPEIAQRLRARGDSGARLELRSASQGLLAVHHRFPCSDAPLARRTGKAGAFDRDPERDKSLAELRHLFPDRMVCMRARRRGLHRKTAETDIRIRLNLDGRGRYKVSTGIRFLDHMLELFARHGGFDLEVEARGDLEVDQHHTVEDIGIVLGQVLRQALGAKKGINRAGYFLMPMDETLAIAAIDLSGRPYLVLNAPIKAKYVGDLQTELLEDFFHGFATSAGANVHLKLAYGRSSHHAVEALFKALARALRYACSRDLRLRPNSPAPKDCCDRFTQLRRRQCGLGAEGHRPPGTLGRGGGQARIAARRREDHLPRPRPLRHHDAEPSRSAGF